MDACAQPSHAPTQQPTEPSGGMRSQGLAQRCRHAPMTRLGCDVRRSFEFYQSMQRPPSASRYFGGQKSSDAGASERSSTGILHSRLGTMPDQP